MKCAFELTGEMALLLHADDVEASDELSEWRSAPENKNISKPGDDRSPAWTWQTYCYTDGENLTVPAGNLMVCLRQAGAQITMKKQKTFKESTQSGMFIPSEHLDLFVAGKQVPWEAVSAIRGLPFKAQADAVQKLGFRLFIKRARVGQSKHVRVRARLDNWSIRGSVQVVAPEISFEVLEKLFEIAGRVGLCDWRPGCKTPGPYGMFAAKIKRA